MFINQDTILSPQSLIIFMETLEKWLIFNIVSSIYKIILVLIMCNLNKSMIYIIKNTWDGAEAGCKPYSGNI